MWNISRPNGGHAGVHSRQFSTMPGPPLLNKTLPGPVNFLSGLCTSFDCMHKISTQKRFVNPNFVNEQNPNVHGYQTAAANNLVEKCSSVFLGSGNQSSISPRSKQETPDVLVLHKQLETIALPSNNVMMECEEAKENTKRKKMTNRKTKKRHSLSSPRKGGNKGKAKSTFNLKYEVDEVGLDPLSDSYDSDLCSSPLSRSPAPAVDGNIPCFDFGYSISIAAIPESKPKSTVVISINKPKIGGGGCRSRVPSDCGSEDSFIVFQCSPDDVSDVSETEEEEDEEMDTGTESDEEDDSDDSSCSESNFVFKTEDEVDFGGPRAAPRKRVRFADDLFVVHPMHCWSFAYREARRGPWETYALDRGRFKDRVQEAEGLLNPVLDAAHRRKIFDERFARTED